MAYYKKYFDYLVHKTKNNVGWGYFIFFVTNKCNARCKHCFYWRQLNKQTQELSLKEIEKITQKAGKIQVLLLSGGEPFLKENLFEIISLFIKNSRVKVVSIPTNAILTCQIIRTVKMLSRTYPEVTFSINPSIDNLNKKNDEIRGIREAFAQSIKTLEGLVKIKKESANVEVVVNTTISNFNYQDIDEIISFFKQFEITYHNFELLRGSPRVNSANLPPLSAIRKIHQKTICLRNYYINKNTTLSGLEKMFERISVLGITKYTQVLKEQVIKGKAFPFICSAGKNIIVLEPNGDIRLCELLPTIGNLRDYNFDIEKLLNNKKAKKIFNFIKTCRCTHVCFLNMSIAYDHKSLFKIPYYFLKWHN